MSDIKANNFLLTKQKSENKIAADIAKNAAEHQKLELEIVTDPEEAEYRIKDFEIAKMIGTALCAKYPGHGWQVESDSRNGIAKIYMSQMSSRAGYIYKLKDITLGVFDRDMMRVGGDILERFGIARGKFTEGSVMGIIRDIRGDAIADLS